MPDVILHEHDHDGIDRRGFLRCMAWAGTGMLWYVNGGVPVSARIGGTPADAAEAAAADLAFIQISDSHIGFSKEANPDVTGTLEAAVARINALPVQPAFLIHTGDVSQLSKASEFDTARQIIAGARTGTGRVFYVPGEHDVIGDAGAEYRRRFAPKARGGGWYSFDVRGVHFIGLVNVLDLRPGGLGTLGREQLEWLERDVRGLATSTPIVVFAHVPLWTVYPEWGWATEDGQQALGYLKRFGSVTVLNGHIHQVFQKTEGHVTFHTAMSTAFPQPAPGAAPGPGPMRVAAPKLQDFLGLTSVSYVHGHGSLAVVDRTLSGRPQAEVAAEWRTAAVGGGAATKAAAGPPADIRIANFRFDPPKLAVAAGSAVTFTNRDDAPHQIASADRRFTASPVLDSGQSWTLRVKEAGNYRYFCSIHPQMVGAITAR